MRATISPLSHGHRRVFTGTAPPSRFGPRVGARPSG
jgi:hypothetical protein